jgi:hypothetical protein
MPADVDALEGWMVGGDGAAETASAPAKKRQADVSVDPRVGAAGPTSRARPRSTKPKPLAG